MSTRLVRIAALAATLALPGLSFAQGTSGPYLAAQQAEMRGDVAAAARYYSRTLARDGENAEVMERAMLHQIAAGNVGEGIALARRLEEIQPGHHLGVLALATDALRKGNLDQVRTLLGTDGPFVGQVIDAWAAFGDGNAGEAKSRLAEIEASDQNGRLGQIVGATHLGLVEAALGNDEAALVALDRASEMSDGGDLRLTRARAAALARLGRGSEGAQVINDRLAGTYGNEALARLAAAITSEEIPAVHADTASEGAADVLHSVSRIMARGQNRLIALAYARMAVFLDPTLTDAQLLIARILDAGQQYDQAVAAYDAIAPEAPEALSAILGKAEVLRDSGKADEGITAMEAAVAQFPDAIEAHTSLGDMLRRESRFEEASGAYSGALDLVTDVEAYHWALFYQRGIANERSKQWDNAEADFRKALELNPDQPDVLNYLGYSWVERGENLAEAEDMIQKAVEQRPDDGYIVDSLGWVLYRFGEFDRAVEHLEHAVELRPVDPVINDHFGDALWMVGRRIEARFQWKRSLSFEPQEEDAERIRRKLDIGLDAVLAEEEAEGLPGIIGRQTENGVAPSQAKDGG